MNTDYVQSIHRAFSIIESFSDEQPRLSLTEIAEKTGLTKTTALRLIGNLVDLGYLKADGKTYFLGLKFLTLGSIAANNQDSMEEIIEVMTFISENLGEHVALNALIDDMRVPIKLIESKHPVTTRISVGKAYPLFAGSAGKTLLAFQSDDYISRYLDTVPLEKLTEITITDKQEILDCLKTIRRDRMYFSIGERVDNVWSCSVPVFSFDGSVSYCLTTGGPVFTLSDTLREKAKEIMKEACLRASGIMGYAK